MQRSFAAMLGIVAMSVVAFRGVLRGDLIVNVVPLGIAAMVVFTIIGAVVGAIADYLIRESLETQYRHRLAEYREALEELNIEKTKQKEKDSAE